MSLFVFVHRYFPSGVTKQKYLSLYYILVLCSAKSQESVSVELTSVVDRIAPAWCLKPWSSVLIQCIFGDQVPENFLCSPSF